MADDGVGAVLLDGLAHHPRHTREAAFLSDRVYVLTARSAQVRVAEEVHLPRPRAPSVVGDAEFWELEAKLLLALREESIRAHVQDDERTVL